MKLCLLDKFPHWSEVLAVLTKADEGTDIPFVSHKWLKEEECYVDPEGVRYTNTVTPAYAGDRALVINGSIHLETHPLSKGKIPYPKLPYKVAIEHTTGYSPWDFLQMVDLAEISASGSEDAQGSKVLYLMNQKCYNRFMNTDWEACGKSYYTPYKEKILTLEEKGFICPRLIEPTQYWLENVPSSYYQIFDSGLKTTGKESSDHICLELNWCNMKKAAYAKQILQICEKLHSYTGKDIDIRLHSYTSQSFLKYFTPYDYVHLYPYESISKYDIMDEYSLYFVDGTGLGYETAYRNTVTGRDVNIFYLNDLPSDEPQGGFDGIVEMGATPQYNLNDFLNGQDKGNFSSDVIRESFPHNSGYVPNECFKIITDATEKLKEL